MKFFITWQGLPTQETTIEELEEITDHVVGVRLEITDIEKEEIYIEAWTDDNYYEDN